MDTDDLTQAHLQYDGTWTALAARKLTDVTTNFGSLVIDAVVDPRTSLGWKGADINPYSAAGQDFRVTSSTATTLSVGSGSLCATLPSGSCTAPPPPVERRYYLREDQLDSLTGATHDLSVLEPVLRKAYIRIRSLVGPPLPWKHNLRVTDHTELIAGTTANTRSHWSVLLVLGFEAGIANDYDPSDESGFLAPTIGRCAPIVPLNNKSICGTGRGPTRQPIAMVFLEAIRDMHATATRSCVRPTVSVIEHRASAAAHEFLHALSLAHDGDPTGGLMCSAIKNYIRYPLPERLDVTAKQVRRLRMLTEPGVYVPETDLPSCTDPCATS